MKFLTVQFHSPVTSSLLGPHILLRTLFSNTLSLCSFFNVRDQVSNPHNTTGRIADLYARGKTKVSEPNGSKHSPNLV
jgi:hypothetical protein